MKINFSSSKDLKTYGLFGLIILIMLIMIISISKDYLTSPSVGVIEQAKPDATNKLRLLEFEGKKFNFSYPNLFQPVQSSPVTGSDIEKYAFVASQSTIWNMNIKVTALSQDNLSYDGSYNLRKTNPQSYNETVMTLGNNEAHIMTSKEGGYSKVAFLLNGKVDATIVLTSSSSIDNTKMDAALNQMIASWKWL